MARAPIAVALARTSLPVRVHRGPSGPAQVGWTCALNAVVRASPRRRHGRGQGGALANCVFSFLSTGALCGQFTEEL